MKDETERVSPRLDEEALSLSLFDGMDAATRRKICDSARTLILAEGERLFHRGEMPQGLHFLLSGQVGLYQSDATGKEVIAEVIDTGGVFLLAAALTRKPYLLSGVALSSSSVLELPVDAVHRLLHEQPDFAIAMLIWLSERYRTHIQEIGALSDALESRLFPGRIG